MGASGLQGEIRRGEQLFWLLKFPAQEMQHNIVAKCKDSAQPGLPGFRFRLCHLLVLCPGTSVSSSLKWSSNNFVVERIK